MNDRRKAYRAAQKAERLTVYQPRYDGMRPFEEPLEIEIEEDC